MILGYSTFGYEGLLVNVEVDLRRGIPAMDIVGIADNCVKEVRERVRCAIRNTGFSNPTERVLISLSPADVKKDGASWDLPIALGILEKVYEKDISDMVLVMGELGLSGKVRPVRGINAGLQQAYAQGIKYAIIPQCENIEVPSGMRVVSVGNLSEAFNFYTNLASVPEKVAEEESSEIQFADLERCEESLDNVKNHNFLKYAMAVAVAGRHHLIVWGAPGCDKTVMLQRINQLLPKLLQNEKHSVRRIYSLAGLDGMYDNNTLRPIRMPHQTASIEGMCGGGVNCRPGEITLAHNGVLFLDEAAEFRSSVLQMLRVPMEQKSITLSRAGRQTVYPANFQLVMAFNPCPCGNYGSKDRVCLCSARSVEQYWRKFSSPLLGRVAIRVDVSNELDEKYFTLTELRELIKTAWTRQFNRQGKLNNDLESYEIEKYIHLTTDAKTYLAKCNLNNLETREVLKLARTLADIHSNTESETVDLVYVKCAMTLHATTPLETL